MFLKRNQTQIVSIVSLSLLSITGLTWSNLGAIAEENNQQPATNQENTNTRETQRGNSRSILATIWEMLGAKREKEPALSSRNGICEITPGLLENINLIYSDRPLFLWQGTAPNLAVHLYTIDLDLKPELLWSQTVDNQSRSLTYTGEPLQPGQTYDWEITTANPRRISFQVMPQSERDRISDELQSLETRLAASGATIEQISLAKAEYFAEQNLWSDALQQLHSIENPSTETMENIEEITSYMCQSK